MKDQLQDLIEHTFNLGFIDLIKVSGSDQTTQLNAIAEDRSVMISGEFKAPMADFIGVFGMPNLSKLKTILGFDVYKENATISVTKTDRDGVATPTAIHFENKEGDFVNDYRLMSKSIAEEKVKNVSFKGANWNIEFQPTVEGIRRLKLQASANSEEKVFTTKLDGTNLKISFGDPSTHSGSFVFQSGITSGTSTKQLQWPVQQFMSILDLAGDKTVRISDQGAAEITVDSGIATYQFLLPAQTK